MTKAVKHIITATVEIEVDVNPDSYPGMNEEQAARCDASMDLYDLLGMAYKLTMEVKAVGLLGQTLATAKEVSLCE